MHVDVQNYHYFHLHFCRSRWLKNVLLHETSILTPPPSSKYHSHMHASPVPHCRNSQATKYTSHLRYKGISLKSLLWIIEEDHASLTLIILQSIRLASPPIASAASDDRCGQSGRLPLLQLETRGTSSCLHSRNPTFVMGVLTLEKRGDCWCAADVRLACDCHRWPEYT